MPSIVKMCRWMEVSRSGFYDWRNAPESATVKRRGILALYVKKSFGDSDETYGYRRVHADLAGWGVPAGPELVRSLMRELGLEPCQPRPWRFSLTEGDGQEHDIPDLVQRDFTAEKPGEKMVGDITYVPTWEGWLYLAERRDAQVRGWRLRRRVCGAPRSLEDQFVILGGAIYGHAGGEDLDKSPALLGMFMHHRLIGGHLPSMYTEDRRTAAFSKSDELVFVGGHGFPRSSWSISSCC